MNLQTNSRTWELGYVVALKTHFYFNKEHTNLVVLTGDPKLISPLMVVIEILPPKKGMVSSDFQCKCMWFSHKTYQFEQAWFFSTLLKVIDDKIESQLQYEFGLQVELRPSIIELGKKKSTLKIVNSSSSYTTTAELNFVSPTMQIVGQVPFDDKKNSAKNRIVSQMSYKCKYYNPTSDKFSEVLIPKEALNIIQSVRQEFLEILEEVIMHKNYISITQTQTKKIVNRIMKPNVINYRNGRYFLVGYDYIELKNKEINLIDISSMSAKENYFVEKLPDFIIKTRVSVKPASQENILELLHRFGTKHYFSIKYKNDDGIITNRTINLIDIIPSEESDTSYIKAYCHLRKAERMFRLDRIIEIYVLDTE